MGAADALSNILAALLPAQVIGGVEEIESGNEAMLSSAELAAMPESVNRQRASGSARGIARRLLARMGCPGTDILWLPNGAPAWPPGFMGSLAHDKLMAVGTIARSAEFSGIGIDVEAAEPLDDEVIQVVASRSEQQQFCRSPIDGKLLFSIKEAVFKAVNPTDRVFLEFHDVMVDGDAMTAETRYGRMVHWRAGTRPRILAIAWW